MFDLTNDNLISGNWEEVLSQLPDASFKLIYQDPPYEINYNSNIPGSKDWNKTGESDSKFDKPMHGDFVGGVNWEKLANECFRLLKDDSFLFLHCNIGIIMNYLNCFSSAGFNIKGTIVWNKRFSIGGDLKSSMQRPWEPIVYMTKGKPCFRKIKVLRKYKIDNNSGKVISAKHKPLWEEVERGRISEVDDWIFSLTKKEKCGFPTQKPIDLCKQVIELTTDIGDLVLDPFCGSGSISVATKMLNRKYFTTEIEQKTYEIAKSRLDKL